MNIKPIVFALAAFGLSTAAQAQDANAQKALQKAQFMLRQATSEKAQLQTQVDALQKQVDQLTRDLTATKSNAASAQQRTEEKYTGSLAQWKQRDSEVNAELTSTRDRLKQESEQRKALEQQLQIEKNNFSVCYENNKKFYDINRELLSHYENKGLGDVLKQKDFLAGIKQVEVENLVQDYRYKLDDLRVRPIESAAGTTDSPQQIHNN